EYDGVNDFDPSGTSEDTFNLLADDTQSFVLNEEESLNMTFANWKKLDEWLENYELEQSFAFTITHSDKDKDDAHTNENRNRGHNTNNCKFHINAYCRKKDNLVHITKVEGEHNHELVENIRMVSPCYRKLTPEMRDDIALLATCGVRAGAIIEKNLEKHFLSKYHGEKWNKFFAAFCYARNSRVESIFEERWATLLQEYPDATSYLEAWVLCFTHRAFNAGIQSTQRIESYNSIIKNNVNGSSSLTELEHTIERLLAKESKFIKLNKPLVTVESPRGMFSEDMFDACVIELTQLIADSTLSNISAISLLSNNGFGTVEHAVELDFSYLESIRGCHLIKEMESEVTQIVQGNETTKFACTISNPISIRKKGRKPKNVSGNHKGKKRQVVECNQNKENSIYDNEELPHKRLRKALQDNLNTVNLEINENVEGESSKSTFRRCGICSQKGYNARTCSNNN
ncbi:4267_t:CDS:10, partial [Funneliformis caledonium]